MNTRYQVGDQVRYHPIIGRAHDGKVYTIRHAQPEGIPSHPHPVYWLSPAQEPTDA
jgi:hypothetical protein